MPKRFHLGWFTNFTPGDWNQPFSHGGSPWDGKFFVEMALAMERACFDYIMLEETLMVSEAYRGTAEAPQTRAAGAKARSAAPRRHDRCRHDAARRRRHHVDDGIATARTSGREGWGTGRLDQHCDDADHAKPVVARAVHPLPRRPMQRQILLARVERNATRVSRWILHPSRGDGGAPDCVGHGLDLSSASPSAISPPVTTSA
jgi:hypothetical protein